MKIFTDDGCFCVFWRFPLQDLQSVADEDLHQVVSSFTQVVPQSQFLNDQLNL